MLPFLHVPRYVHRALAVEEEQARTTAVIPNPNEQHRPRFQPHRRLRNDDGSSADITTSQLAYRFAQMLTERQRMHEWNDSKQHSSRKRQHIRTRRSKNCGRARTELGKVTRRIRKLRVCEVNNESNDTDNNDEIRMDSESEADDEEEYYGEKEQEAALNAMLLRFQDTIVELERSVLLQDSALMMRRTNRTAMAVELNKLYHDAVAFGYDPMNSNRAVRTITTQRFMESAFAHDMICRDFKGTQRLLDQWEKYTTFYANLRVRLRSIKLIDERETHVSVRSLSDMRMIFIDDTFKFLFPSFYQQMLIDPQAQAIANKLIGKEVKMEFDLVLHFNHQGQVFAHESRVHIVSALLNVLKDPFATMRVVESALITQDGHWKIQHDSEMYDRVKALPTPLL